MLFLDSKVNLERSVAQRMDDWDESIAVEEFLRTGISE
jgi:hypothetical protein